MTVVEREVDETAPPVPDAAEAAPVRRVRDLRLIVLALLVFTAIKQLALVVVYPPFQGHDEVAHLGYLWLMATGHRLPTLSDTLPYGLSSYANFTLDWPALYTANHPPLFYLLSWPAYYFATPTWLAKLYAVRLVSVGLFLLTVWLSYRLAAAIAPSDPLVVIGVPAVIAFQPQLSFEGAIVNNDMLAICIGTWILYLCVLAVRRGLTRRRALTLGVAVGLGLLAKATITALVPVVAFAAVYACWPRPWARVRTRDYWRPVLTRALLVVATAGLLPLPWYLYLYRTYGDFTAFNATRQLQSSWNRPAGTFWQLLTSTGFHRERLRESWGDFGWKMIPLGQASMGIVYAVLALVAIGLLVALFRLGRAYRQGTLQLESRQVVAVGLLTGAVLLLYGAMVYFGTMFLLTQARYVFPIFPAGAVVGLLGLGALVPERRRAEATVAVAGASVLFYLWIFFAMVVPYAVL